ncbi:MAG: hypothetical protein LBJ08_06680, partial [Bifidobacteriaceae bacterium]|nr:hypothetical protein [Bifidobacteriaceae bacterium]
MSYDSWLSRYRRGEREQVWHELRCLGGRVREPRHYANAQAVCDEMARRARHNVETLVEHLIEQGFNFHTNDCEQQAVVPFAPATASAVSLVEWLEDHIGPVPMTVAAWVRLVGDVWLVGTHSGWPESAQADPLVIEIEGSRYPAASMIANYADQYQQWREGHVDGTE